jgi:Cu/Ag efflux pump CusA
VFGIAARNGITLIRGYQNLQRDEGESFGLRLILRGSGERSLPILMTALATGLAFVPALVLGDIPGLEVLRPMAVVVLGGLVTSTLLNLFVLPSLALALRVSSEPDLELGPDRHASPVQAVTRSEP